MTLAGGRTAPIAVDPKFGWMAGSPSAAQIPPPADAEGILAPAYTGKSYSPYAGRGFATRPLWGDSHVHTKISLDAVAFGNRICLDES